LGFPGLALGIVQDGQIAHVQGFGFADSSGRTVTPQTPFYIGSVTKSFTALAVMQLVEAGKIDLDAPVQTYLPWFELADKEASSMITVRHLLNLTSGISEKDGNRFWSSQEGLEETVRGLGSLPLTQPVGTTWQYGNINPSIAGLIVEVVSGQSYADYVTEHIFEPLDMRHSYASHAPALADGLAEGHTFMFGRIFSDKEAMPLAYLPAGGLMASVEDLSHYMIAHLSEGYYGDTSVLSSQGIAELHAPSIPVAEGDHYYALGWNVNTVDGIPVLYHSGDTGNFHAVAFLMPDSNSGVIVLTNASGFEQYTSGATDAIGVGIFNMLNGKPPAAVSVPFLVRFLYWAILLTPVVQIFGILFVWRKRQGMRVWPLVLTVILNLGLVFFILRQSQNRMPLPSLIEFNPELGYLSIAVAVLGIGWSVIYTAMNLRMGMRRAN
jgi:CubicO group peptidase (beta-lactamase class C family)